MEGSLGFHRNADMDWELAYTPYIWPSLLVVLLMLVMVLYSEPRRNVPGVIPFMIGSLLGVLWAAGSVAEYAAVAPATKIFWVKFQASWQLPAVTTITCFALEYAWPGRWLTRRNLTLLSIAPLLVLGFIWTDDRHHLIWRSFGVDGTSLTEMAPVGWVVIIYSFGLMILSLIILVWLFVHSPQHRWPVAIMVTGHIGVRTMFVLDKINLIHSDLPLDVLGLAFIDLLYGIALFGFRLFDPIPLARQTAIEQLRDGMLVVDPLGRIASLNPAAEHILGMPAGRVKDRLIQDLIPSYRDRLRAAPDGTESEIALSARDSLRSGHEFRDYTLETSPLKDWRGLEVGRLVLLHDVTEQKKAQAQIIEQQRSLAMLQEREHLARELHDGLGQALAAAHLQASTARRLLDLGETTQTGECLNILADATLQAEADIREYLLGAQSVVSSDHQFFATLREYLKRFTRQYDLPVELSVLPELEEQNLPQTVGVQLLRIIQEGLSNIRKHAHARCAQVSLALSGGLLQVTVSDDGLGFDPSAVAPQPGAGFGLRSMRERAETLSGSLRIDSTPGKGTRVVVEVPVSSERPTGNTEAI